MKSTDEGTRQTGHTAISISQTLRLHTGTESPLVSNRIKRSPPSLTDLTSRVPISTLYPVGLDWHTAVCWMP
jgi:hypothetical protein